MWKPNLNKTESETASRNQDDLYDGLTNKTKTRDIITRKF